MTDKVKRVFRYHAHAHALSGSMNRPVSRSIDAQATAVLPTTGGYGTARVENYRMDHHIQIKAGYSHVAGSKQQKNGQESHTTLVTSVVEGLNLLDVVTADRVVVRLSGAYSFPDEESRFSFIGTTFENLKICGHPVVMEWNDRLLTRLDTFEKVKKELETNKEFKKMAEDPFHSGTPTKLREGKGEILCSLVKSMKTDASGVTIEGHALVIPDFGTIYVAEAHLGVNRRTLSMLRFELGSPVDGSGVVAEADINGSHFP